MAAPVHQHLVQKGVSLYLEEGVTHFQRTEQGITVFLTSGKTIPADMVLLSIGVRPATALALSLIHILSKILGHSNIRMTQHYAKVLDSSITVSYTHLDVYKRQV